MPKGLAEAIIRIRAGNAMGNCSKRKQMVYKILHGKLKIEQHEHRKIRYALSVYPVYCFIQYTFIEYNIVRAIRFRYCGLPHEAVLVRIAQAEDITLNVIHYNYAGIIGTREVVNEEMGSDENMHIQYTFIEYNIVRYSDLIHYCMYLHNFTFFCSFCFYFTPF
jgi:hypothetical protein